MGKQAFHNFFFPKFSSDSPRLVAVAHFNQSNCLTVATILSSFDVWFKGVAELSSVVFRYITRNKLSWKRGRPLDALARSASLTQGQTARDLSCSRQRAARSFRGLLEGKRWTLSGCKNTTQPGGSSNTHTHTQTNKHTHTWPWRGDGKRWMVRSGWYDCGVVNEDKRKTDELPLHK